MTDQQQKIRTTFFGTTSLHITDGTTNIFIDAFISRPPILKVLFGKIGPDVPLIHSTLHKAHVTHLDALFVAHTHYDHVLDAPEVVRHLGGTLYGSESTLNIARGSHIPASRLQLIHEDDVYTHGDFTVRIFEGLHSPGNKFPGAIPAPLSLPTRCSHMKDGGCFSFYISHPRGRMLIHPSANYVPGKFDGFEVDVLYLGIGVLGAQSREFREEYWRHLVGVTKPRLILPIHWDDFLSPLGRGLKPLPWYLDSFGEARGLVERQARHDGIDVIWQGPLETLDIFEVTSGSARGAASKRVQLSDLNESLGGGVRFGVVLGLGVAAMALALYWHST